MSAATAAAVGGTSSVTPFQLVPMIENVIEDRSSKAEITSVELWDNNVYVGTSDGFLLYFVLERGVSPTGKTTYQSRLESKKHLGLGKKAVDKILAVPRHQKLVVVCNGTMIIMHMYNLKVDTSANGTLKNVGLVCHDEASRSRSSLVVARRKSATAKALCLYRLTEELTGDAELPVPELPLAMARFGNAICLAFPRAYSMMHIDQGAMIELFAFDVQVTRPAVKVVGAGEFLLGVTTSLDTLAMFVSEAGTPSRAPLQLSSNPLGVGYNHPYVVSMCDDVVQVHSTIDQLLKQSVPFRSGRTLTDCNGNIVAATHQVIYALDPVPVSSQIQGMLRERRVSEALTLADEALPHDSDDFDGQKRRRALRRIQQQAGFVYLAMQSFEQAEEMFTKSLLDPRELVVLCPWLMPKLSMFRPERPPLHAFQDMKGVVGETPEAMHSAHAFLLKYLESIRDTRLAIGKRDEIDTALLRMYADAAAATLPDTNFISQTVRPGVGLSLESSNGATTKSDVAIGSSSMATSSSGAATEPDSSKAQHRYAKQKLLKRLRDHQSKLQLTPSKVVSPEMSRLIAFVNQPNSCAAEDCEDHLQQRQLYHALALFCAHTGKVRKALDTWLQLDEKRLADPSYGGLGHMIDLLRTTTSVELVRRFGEYVLHQDPREGARIFTERLDLVRASDDASILSPSSSASLPASSSAVAQSVSLGQSAPVQVPLQLAPDDILEFLGKFGRIPVVAYLEFLLQNLSLEEKYHTQLALLYLDDVQEQFKLVKSSQATDDDRQNLSDARGRLAELLETSNYYRVPVLLGRIRDTELYSECAILYGKMDEHEKALSILVHRLQDFKGAERYCAVTQGVGREFRRNLYLTLLKVYMTPVGGGEPLVIPAVDLLNNQGSHFDVAKVMELLPSDWSINLVSQFLQRGIDENLRHARELMIVKNLLRAQYISTRNEQLSLRRGGVLVTESTTCNVCSKLFSHDAAVVRYPNGVVCHLHCCRPNKSECPVTGVFFNRERR
ncbi:TGF beta receptor associated protein [Capsaspora owczarzaki ATCC 30864]|uniref:TGF beta receptor associated protein n=1 Tax=Capsaspora owczarzaki (strain ATCC 30864) TaxID=595528 RepID=A0A0D2VFI6_CAPO3|nr:TGF beta receptor associated protein [Capsaspora owczarzaki ATCC 30864]KJE88502.1 TGF beta receptor associated protein [Capsaspora owczarzaki ATCC 30864]|eukprot:XP_004365022.1 TGF beta receptor associated protein [Capsaspora owczarzaki ATCC 30864]